MSKRKYLAAQAAAKNTGNLSNRKNLSGFYQRIANPTILLAIGVGLILIVGVIGATVGNQKNVSTASGSAATSSAPSAAPLLPNPSPTPQLAKEYVYAGSRLLAVEEGGSGQSSLSLTAAPSNVATGGSVVITWNAPQPNSNDWIGLYTVGSGNSGEHWWSYTGGGATGSFNVTVPSQAGQYEFRYFVNNQSVAASNTVTVGGSGTVTRTLTVASTNPSSSVSVTISPADNNNQGNGATQFTRTYNNNTAVTLTAPATAGGNNFQKWQRNGTDLSTNSAVTVTVDANYTMTAVYVQPSGGLSLTGTPSTVAPGGQLTVTWTAPNPTTNDWIGLYAVGSPNSGEYWWNYTRNSTTGNSFTLTAPSAPGQYEFRFFIDNASQHSATSNTVTVTSGFSVTTAPQIKSNYSGNDDAEETLENQATATNRTKEAAEFYRLTARRNGIWSVEGLLNNP